jgi:hypothetical protein
MKSGGAAGNSLWSRPLACAGLSAPLVHFEEAA